MARQTTPDISMASIYFSLSLCQIHRLFVSSHDLRISLQFYFFEPLLWITTTTLHLEDHRDGEGDSTKQDFQSLQPRPVNQKRIPFHHDCFGLVDRLCSFLVPDVALWLSVDFSAETLFVLFWKMDPKALGGHPHCPDCCSHQCNYTDSCHCRHSLVYFLPVLKLCQTPLGTTYRSSK